MPTCSGRSSWCTSPPDRPPTTAPCAGRRPGRLPSVGECAAGTARCCDNRPNSQATRLPCRRVRIRIPAGEGHGDGRHVVCPVRSHGQGLASRQGPMGRRVEWTAPRAGPARPRTAPWDLGQCRGRPTGRLCRDRPQALEMRSAGVDVSVCGGCIPRSVRRLHIAGSAVSRETAGRSEGTAVIPPYDGDPRTRRDTILRAESGPRPGTTTMPRPAWFHVKQRQAPKAGAFIPTHDQIASRRYLPGACTGRAGSGEPRPSAAVVSRETAICSPAGSERGRRQQEARTIRSGDPSVAPPVDPEGGHPPSPRGPTWHPHPPAGAAARSGSTRFGSGGAVTQRPAFSGPPMSGRHRGATHRGHRWAHGGRGRPPVGALVASPFRYRTQSAGRRSSGPAVSAGAAARLNSRSTAQPSISRTAGRRARATADGPITATLDGRAHARRPQSAPERAWGPSGAAGGPALAP
jgi:hypothetical protein